MSWFITYNCYGKCKEENFNSTTFVYFIKRRFKKHTISKTD